MKLDTIRWDRSILPESFRRDRALPWDDLGGNVVQMGDDVARSRSWVGRWGSLWRHLTCNHVACTDQSPMHIWWTIDCVTSYLITKIANVIFAGIRRVSSELISVAFICGPVFPMPCDITREGEEQMGGGEDQRDPRPSWLYAPWDL